jgi:exopolysaccharide biosynthesis polyprenyl glycosylphosphotransferase
VAAPAALPLEAKPAEFVEAPPAGPSSLPAATGEGRARDVNLKRDQLFRHALLLADLSAVITATAVMSVATPRTPRLGLPALVALLAVPLAAKVLGLYDRDEALLHKTTLDEAPVLFQLATLVALCAWLVGGLLISGDPLGRVDALALWALLLVLLTAGRAIARALSLRAAPVEQCLFIGDGRTARTIEAKLSGSHGLKAELVASVDPTQASRWTVDGLSAPRLRHIRELARSLGIERAIIAADSVEPGRMLDLVRSLQAAGVKVSVLPRLLEVVGSAVEFDDLHGVTVMGLRRFALSRSSMAIKRGFDLVGAVLGLIVISPLLAALALAIRLDGPGPVLFRQRRVGRHGAHFDLYKFRTMVPDADALKDSLRHRNEACAGLFKIADDPRITRVGRFLRRSGLDELPQLFNIVRGEMSLVGPRPLVIDEDECVTGWFRRRLELMPGITGPWQILGPARVPLSEMGAIDYLYVANWSLWGDLKILLRTVGHVLGRRGL